MLSDDVILKNPLTNWFVYIIQIICLCICGLALFVFFRYPFKLNRTDYDFNRRSTMVTSYMNKGGNENTSTGYDA